MKTTTTSHTPSARRSNRPARARRRSSSNGNGNGNSKANGNGNGHKIAPTVTSEPHYDDGGHYDSGLHYAVGVDDLPPPPTQVSKVKLEMGFRTDSDLVGWVTQHIDKIAVNASFPDPQPLPADLAAALAEFQTQLGIQTAALETAKAATVAKDFARRQLEDLMIARGAYVQTASGGSGALITNVGLGIRNQPSPVGILPPPINIRIDLTSVAGMMILRWSPVPRSRGYLVECSEDVVPRAWSQIKNSGKASLTLQGLQLGKTYVFRIASSGGSSGQSDWSPEVKRGAA